MSTLPEMILEDLRWKPDQAIINYEGESVWLKQVRHPPIVLKGFYGPSGGWHPPLVMWAHLVDCCYTASPCERHGEMA